MNLVETELYTERGQVIAREENKGQAIRLATDELEHMLVDDEAEDGLSAAAI